MEEVKKFNKVKDLRLRMRPMYSDKELENYKIKIESANYRNFALEQLGEWLEEAFNSHNNHNVKTRVYKKSRYVIKRL